METFGERLLAIYNSLPYNKSEFAKELGMKNPQGINPYLKANGSVFGGELLAVFSEKFPQFNILWLLTGKGEMYNAGFAPPKKSEPSEILETIEELKALVTGFTKRIEMLEAYVFRKTDDLIPAGKTKAKLDPHLLAAPFREKV